MSKRLSRPIRIDKDLYQELSTRYPKDSWPTRIRLVNEKAKVTEDFQKGMSEVGRFIYGKNVWDKSFKKKENWKKRKF